MDSVELHQTNQNRKRMQCFNAVVRTLAFTASFLVILGSSLQRANATLNDIPKVKYFSK